MDAAATQLKAAADALAAAEQAKAAAATAAAEAEKAAKEAADATAASRFGCAGMRVRCPKGQPAVGGAPRAVVHDVAWGRGGGHWRCPGVSAGARPQPGAYTRQY